MQNDEYTREHRVVSIGFAFFKRFYDIQFTSIVKANEMLDLVCGEYAKQNQIAIADRSIFY